jgi:hypothetical protein
MKLKKAIKTKMKRAKGYMNCENLKRGKNLPMSLARIGRVVTVLWQICVLPMDCQWTANGE